MIFLDVVAPPGPVEGGSAELVLLVLAAVAVLAALLRTLALEVPAAFLLGVRDKWDLCLVALINCVTNPLVNAALMTVRWAFPDNSAVWWGAVAATEALAWIGEWLFFRRYICCGKLHPLLLSVILNGLSFTLGLLFL